MNLGELLPSFPLQNLMSEGLREGLLSILCWNNIWKQAPHNMCFPPFSGSSWTVRRTVSGLDKTVFRLTPPPPLTLVMSKWWSLFCCTRWIFIWNQHTFEKCFGVTKSTGLFLGRFFLPKMFLQCSSHSPKVLNRDLYGIAYTEEKDNSDPNSLNHRII